MNNVRIYLVGSLYTLLNAINLESFLSKKGTSKTYLVYFGTPRQFHQNLFNFYEGNLFDSIYVENHPNENSKLINLTKIIFKRKKGNKIKIGKRDYVEIISQNLIFTLLAPCRRYKSISFNYIEEGLSTYTDHNHIPENRNFWIKLINKYLYNSRLFPEFKYLYIYNETIYRGVMNTRPLPKFNFNLFKIQSEKTQEEVLPKKIFLGTPIKTIDSLLKIKVEGDEKMKFQSFVRNKLDYVHSVLIEYDFSYKPHPNEVLDENHQRFNLYQYEIPWELNIKIIKNSNILISVFSTASVTPKILSDKEPTIIFLFRILYPYEFFKAEEFFERVKNSYRNKNKVLAPKSIDELSKILFDFGKQTI